MRVVQADQSHRTGRPGSSAGWSGCCTLVLHGFPAPFEHATRTDHQIRRSGQIVQDRPLRVMCWADVPGLSAQNRRCPAAWQQTAGAARKPNRISSSGHSRPDWFKLDQRACSVLCVRRCMTLNCHPNCTPDLPGGKPTRTAGPQRPEDRKRRGRATHYERVLVRCSRAQTPRQPSVY